ncbi:MAG: LLM class flavin-dependent oxidoreductase [Thermoleophilia bacterium]|nr:LLM class flavin-dependent oxidoreductase [Thermoleophilia bacterium]
MRIGVRLPQYASDWHTLRATAQALVDHGADHVWLNDHVQAPGRMPAVDTFEAFTTLAGVAATVPGARVGVAVAAAGYRPAFLAAKMASVLDAIGSGGVILGLGTGSDAAEHAAFGVPMPSRRERTRRLTDALDVVLAMRDHPAGARVAGALRNAPNLPAPSALPVWVAAHKPVLLRHAGRLADGVIAAWTGPDELRARLDIADAAAAEAGRPRPAACVYTYCLPAWSAHEADAWLRPEADALGTTPAALRRWLATTGLVGTPDEVRDRLGALADAGATDVVLALPNRVPLEAYLLAASCRIEETALPARATVPVATGHERTEASLVFTLVGRHIREGRGDLIAVVDDEGAWTYRRLAAAARRAAGALAGWGVRGGDRVVVALPDGRSWVAAFLGAAALGAVAVPLDPGAGTDVIASILEDCAPRVVVAGDGVDTGRVPRMPPAALADGPERMAAPVHPDDLAYIIYSSGSTGRPKGAMHAHRDMAVSVEGYARRVLGMGPGVVSHSAARLFTSLGFGNGFFRPLGCGATTVLRGPRPNPRVTLDTVARHGVEVLTAVPTFWSQLATFLDRHPAPGALDGVRMAVSSGDALPPAVARHLRDTAGIEVLQGLGCSECSNVVLSTRPGDPLDGRVGTPVPGADVELRDPDGAPVPDGAPGRLWIRCPSNTSGYWRRRDLTRELVHGEWIRMGDILVRDGDVYRHVGRADDLFKVDARWVVPSRVEGVLMELAEVAAAAVAGVDDDRGLTRVHAWVVPRGASGVDPVALRRHVARRLDPHAAPVAVWVRDVLPQLPSGKLDRRALAPDDDVSGTTASR